MARPVKCRNIASRPKSYYFKPRAVPLCELEEETLAADEFQALKYADYDGMEQKQAAALMGISRQTFGNILASSRKKIAAAIVYGRALRIENTGETENETLHTSRKQ